MFDEEFAACDYREFGLWGMHAYTYACIHIDKERVGEMGADEVVYTVPPPVST